ncbi:MAG: hypothetical protein WAL87_02790 [Chthoniobacterales bacterium]
MPFSPTTNDEAEHPPALSGTPTAWTTLGIIALLIAGWLLADELICGAIRATLVAVSWHRGESVRVEKLSLDGNGGVEMHGVEWIRGPKEHRSSLKCDRVTLRLNTPWRMIVPAPGQEHRFLREVLAGKSRVLVDLRETPSTGKPPSGSGVTTSWPLPNPDLLPSALTAGPLDVVVIGENGRFAVNGLHLRLPSRWPGRILFGDATADVGSWHRTIPKGSAPAFWDGNTLRIGELGLGEGIELKEMTLKPLAERLEFGLRGMIGKGILRGDGSLSTAGPAARLEVTLVGEHLGLEAFSGLMKDDNRATGTIQQARFTFRGDPGRPLDADSALRLVARNFRWEGKGWESLRVAATLTGRTLTVSEMLLRQGDNEFEAEGQSRIPADWRAILRAPFSGTFRASLADAGTLAALAGPGLGRLGGGLSFEGELRGADNKAEGYCNFTGSGTRLRDLSVDWLKGCILFEGEKTQLAYLEASAGGDRIVAEGTVANSRPHAYSAKADVAVKNLTSSLAQLGITTPPAIGGGALRATWQGAGETSTTNHTGTFQASVSDWVSRRTKAGMSGRFEGGYSPGRLELSKAEFFQGDLTLSMQLKATRGNITASSIKATRAGKPKPLLEGYLSLPVDPNDFRESGDALRTLAMDSPVSMNMLFRGIKAEELADLLGQQAGFTGTLEGEIAANGTPAEPDLNGTLRIGKFSPGVGGAPRDLSLAVSTGNHIVSVGLEQQPALNSPLRLQATLPLRLAIDQGRLRLADESAPIEASATLRQVPLDGWIDLLDGKKTLPLLQATATGDVKLMGTVAKPTLEGSLGIKAREAILYGPTRLQNLNLTFRMDGKSPVITMTNGSASYAGKPLALSGTLAHVGQQNEAKWRLDGNELPVSLGSEIHAVAAAALQLSSKGTNAPVLAGTITLKPAALDLHRKLTPVFAPPGLTISPVPFSTQGAQESSLDNLQLDLAVKTPALPHTERESPTLAPLVMADLMVKGPADSPKVTGSVTAINQTLRLPAGTFYYPEARLIFGEDGARFDAEPAFGITSVGLCTVTPGGPASALRCGIAGPEGTTAPDLMMALLSPVPKRGEKAVNSAAILQGAAWARQAMLFPTPAAEWSTSRLESHQPGALGFYGTPWIWNWSEGSTHTRAATNTEPHNTSR